MTRISEDTLTAMIAVHRRADPYSPYGNSYTYETAAMRSAHTGQKRALWLEAARHWRTLMRECAAIRDMKRYWRAHKFARIALSAAHYA